MQPRALGADRNAWQDRWAKRTRRRKGPEDDLSVQRPVQNHNIISMEGEDIGDEGDAPAVVSPRKSRHAAAMHNVI